MSMPFIGTPSRQAEAPMLNNSNVALFIRQQPKQGLVAVEHKEKSRKPIDPPPIVQIAVQSFGSERDDAWLVSPFLFMIATLLEGPTGDEVVPGSPMIGQSSSSLHRLKDITNKDGGFFVFGDLSIKRVGLHRLRFNLFNADHKGGGVTYISHIDSDPFPVVINKEFTGLTESSHLSRTFSDQGVRLRLRKEPRQLGGSAANKRNFSSLEACSPPDSRAPYTAQGSHYTYTTPSIKRQRSDSDYDESGSYPRYQDSSASYYGHHASSSGGRSWYSQSQGTPQHASALPGYTMPFGSSPNMAYEAPPAAMNPLSAPGAAAYPRSFPQGPLSGYGSDVSMTRPSSMQSRSGFYSGDYEAQSGSAQYGGRMDTSASLHTPTDQPAQQPAYLASSAGPSSQVGSVNMISVPADLNYSTRSTSTHPDFPPSTLSGGGSAGATTTTAPFYPAGRDPPLYPPTLQHQHSHQQSYPASYTPSDQHDMSLLNSAFVSHDSFGSLVQTTGGLHGGAAAGGLEEQTAQHHHQHPRYLQQQQQQHVQQQGPGGQGQAGYATPGGYKSYY
ncbi:hypothetical protein B0A50_07715 [Salinomyces thailandicus]|uniref:Velvet domain-containing protein n=1 Tax=Salinomyces thailandicus TaxID=706561 RepID=A0A4U0TMK4_9PEZI|nr:hypothetical protein B0A50_07715 [Salinomyces thailandica]